MATCTTNGENKLISFQDLVLKLHNYWAAQGCVLVQPLDMEVGAGTFHPATFLRAIGPEPWSAAYVQPSRRPTDGRYGENPNRLQHYYQYQVVIKPSPLEIQELYLGSLRMLGIEHLGLHPFNSLSGGQQQKVLIARALAQDTGVILLDEPTSNLDIWHQMDVMEILRILVRKNDLAAVVAIHDLNMAAQYSDKIIMMKNGRIVASGIPSAVLTERNLENVYNIRSCVKTIDDIPHIIPTARLA